jgi:hypothetical protein
MWRPHSSGILWLRSTTPLIMAWLEPSKPQTPPAISCPPFVS